MPDRHALLGASSAHIWGNCPPSARLCEDIPNIITSFAKEGTQAHSICEALLRNKLLGEDCEIPQPADDEMATCTQAYADFVEEELNEAKAKTEDAKLFVEQELDFGEYVPEGFGTSDAVIISDDTLEVIDFKYGKGVPVNAVENPQLRLYALGAYLALGSLYDFAVVKTVVYQPRIDNISAEVLPLADLIEWAESYIKPRAELAFKGEGEFCVGEHCRFCRAGSTCRARVKEAFQIIDRSATNPDLISDDEIPGILDKLDNAEKWIDAIKKYAEAKALNEGYRWRGYKLVEGRSIRKITDPIKALEVLEQQGFDKEDVTTLKLKGITELEKLVGKGKFGEILGELVIKPKGAPTLVKETDKRPEYSLVEQAFKEET